MSAAMAIRTTAWDRAGVRSNRAAASNLVRKPGRAVLLGARTLRELGTATRNPMMVAALV